ncbi:GH25 family lysozyme [Ectobacillus sp. sgz5001026]|uniref:GH25 family lysozyme n=1 Tax=Ectobacillus sp. sgz5001026 TaxID=3242473 RepID=UPI0036D3683F
MQALTGKEIKMIDVSHYTGSVDWQKVAAAGFKAAYMKVTEGINFIDETFDGHVKWATTFGIACGAYHFARPEINQDPIVEANHFLNTISGHNFELMPVLDYESPAKQYPLSPKFMSEWARNFVNYVQLKTGRAVIVYTGKWFVDMYGIYGINDQPLWASRYADVPPDDFGGWKQWTAWQYSDSEYVDGAGNCDVSYAISLDALKGGNVSTQPQGSSSHPLQFKVNDGSVILPPDWKTNNLGYLTITADVANVRQEPNLNGKVLRTALKDSGHVYLDWSYDSQRFWYKVAEDNWVSDKDASINKDGKTKGVVWVSANSVNVRKGASKTDPIVEQITKVGAYDAWYRYGDWIYVNNNGLKGGWIYFDPAYVKWIR